MIDLKHILSHLPATKVEELTSICQQIVDTGKAEIVVLFGSYARGTYKEQRGKDRGKKSDYDIFIATSNYDTKLELESELRDMFPGRSVPVQAIVEEIFYVNEYLKEKQYFFTDIKREGKMLYNSGKYELAESIKLSPTRRREIAEDDFRLWFLQAIDFYDSFEHKFNKRSYQLASFMLQQVAEMCYTAIEMVFTHYNPYEHNLKELRERVIVFDRRSDDPFPYVHKHHQDLFDYLNFAYIGGRYRSEDDYPVTRTQLKYWSDEAQKLLNITELICNERIECLRGIEQATADE